MVLLVPFFMMLAGCVPEVAQEQAPDCAEAVCAPATLAPGFLYVPIATSGVRSILGYAIDPGTGLLTEVPGTPTPYTPSSGVSSLAVDPLRRYLFVADISGNLHTFRVAADGSLETPPFTLPGALSGNPILAAHPGGQYLYAATSTNQIRAFQIAGDGTLTVLPPLSLPAQPNAFAIHPGGQFAFVTTFVSTASTVRVVAIAPDGSLASTAVTAGPFTAMRSLAVSPSGEFVALGAGNTAAVTLLQFTAAPSLAATDTAQPFTGGITCAGGATYLILADPVSDFIYANCTDTGGGATVPIAGGSPAQFGAPTPSFSLSGSVLRANAWTVTPDGKFAYQSRSTTLNSIKGFTIDRATGFWTAIPGGAIDLAAPTSVQLPITAF